MLKNVVLISVFMSAVLSVDTYAASVTKARAVQGPSVKATTAGAITPKKLSSERSGIKLSNVANTKTKVSASNSADTARFPIVMNLKGTKVSYKGNNNTSGTTTPTTNPVGTAGVSEESLNAVINRVEALESKTDNVITDVNETSSGNYVTDVTADGNTLNVTKTNSLYVPVKDGNSVVDNVEIWMVR